MNYYYDRMIELDADGIDFHPIFTPEDKIPFNTIVSYTREQFKDVVAVPKTAYSFYKIVDGKKMYIDY